MEIGQLNMYNRLSIFGIFGIYQFFVYVGCTLYLSNSFFHILHSLYAPLNWPICNRITLQVTGIFIILGSNSKQPSIDSQQPSTDSMQDLETVIKEMTPSMQISSFQEALGQDSELEPDDSVASESYVVWVFFLFDISLWGLWTSLLGELDESRNLSLSPLLTSLQRYAIVAINIAVYLFGLASPVDTVGVGTSTLPVLYGAKVNALILGGEWWRLITPMFLVSVSYLPLGHN